MTSCWRSTVTMALSRHLWDIQHLNISWPWNSGQRSLKVIDSGTIQKIWHGFPLVFYSNFVPKMHCFLDIRLVSVPIPWVRSLKVIGTDMNQSSAYDFLSMFHGHHGPMSYRFRNKRRFQSKNAIFPHPHVFCTPAKGVCLRIGYRRMGWKTRMLGLPGRERSLMISSSV